MSSTGIERAGHRDGLPNYGGGYSEHGRFPDEKGVGEPYGEPLDGGFRSSLDSGDKGDHTHRKLKSRHIQLIGIGGTIGRPLDMISRNESNSHYVQEPLFTYVALSHESTGNYISYQVLTQT